MIKDTIVETKSSLQADLLGLTVFGKLVDFDEQKMPVVIVKGETVSEKKSARSCVKLSRQHLGADIVLLMVGGNKPVILGVIDGQPMIDDSASVMPEAKQIMKVDGQCIELNAKHELALKCGQTQIKLNKKGKIEIKGRYVLSRAKKANRIQGGSVELN